MTRGLFLAIAASLAAYVAVVGAIVAAPAVLLGCTEPVRLSSALSFIVFGPHLLSGWTETAAWLFPKISEVALLGPIADYGSCVRWNAWGVFLLAATSAHPVIWALSAVSAAVGWLTGRAVERLLN